MKRMEKKDRRYSLTPPHHRAMGVEPIAAYTDARTEHYQRVEERKNKGRIGNDGHRPSTNASVRGGGINSLPSNTIHDSLLPLHHPFSGVVGNQIGKDGHGPTTTTNGSVRGMNSLSSNMTPDSLPMLNPSSGGVMNNTNPSVTPTELREFATKLHIYETLVRHRRNILKDLYETEEMMILYEQELQQLAYGQHQCQHSWGGRPAAPAAAHSSYYSDSVHGGMGSNVDTNFQQGSIGMGMSSSSSSNSHASEVQMNPSRFEAALRFSNSNNASGEYLPSSSETEE